MDFPCGVELKAVMLGALFGILGRFIGWVREDRSRPFSRWRVFWQLPVGGALGVFGAMLMIALGFDDFWKVQIGATTIAILGPDGLEVVLEEVTKRFNLKGSNK